MYITYDPWYFVESDVSKQEEEKEKEEKEK